jgi:hypoxanthine-DNA glycosylase
MSETETHPHPPFIPAHAKVLILGSFPGMDHADVAGRDEWFYASRRNQFWKIMRGVYQQELETTREKKQLFEKHGIAITDLFLTIRRKEKNNLDSSLEIVTYNDDALRVILKENQFSSIFFTSRFVEKHFVRLFPEITTGECLPSPSPRYAKMTLGEKINCYRNLLPQ